MSHEIHGNWHTMNYNGPIVYTYGAKSLPIR